MQLELVIFLQHYYFVLLFVDHLHFLSSPVSKHPVQCNMHCTSKRCHTSRHLVSLHMITSVEYCIPQTTPMTSIYCHSTFTCYHKCIVQRVKCCSMCKWQLITSLWMHHWYCSLWHQVLCLLMSCMIFTVYTDQWFDSYECQLWPQHHRCELALIVTEMLLCVWPWTDCNIPFVVIISLKSVVTIHSINMIVQELN